MNKLIMEKDDYNNTNNVSLNPNQSLKLNKKLILDNNNFSNNLPNINAIKDKTCLNTKIQKSYKIYK